MSMKHAKSGPGGLFPTPPGPGEERRRKPGMRTTEQLERIREMVAMVQAEATRPGTNQARGNWNPEGDCCTGSRIAHALGVSSGTYLDGIDEWAARMALTRTHVIAMLQDAGAGHDPMGPERWPRTPSEVWRRLAEISEVPTLPGRDLRWLNLAGTDMSGLDLHGCNLEKANLRSARMEETDLSFAKLEGAVLAQAKLA